MLSWWVLWAALLSKADSECFRSGVCPCIMLVVIEDLGAHNPTVSCDLLYS